MVPGGDAPRRISCDILHATRVGGLPPPPFVFLPGFRGRAHVTLFDISRDETAVVTSLGWYIFRAMLGVDFFVSDKDQNEATENLNNLLSQRVGPQ